MESIGVIGILCLAMIIGCNPYKIGDAYGPYEPCFNLIEVCRGHKKSNASEITAFLNPGVWNSLNITANIFHDVKNPIQQIRVFRWESDKRKFTHLVNFSVKDMCAGSAFTRGVFDKVLTFQTVGKDCFIKKGIKRVPHLDTRKASFEALTSKFFYGRLRAQVLLYNATENIVCVNVEAMTQKDPCPKIV